MRPTYKTKKAIYLTVVSRSFVPHGPCHVRHKSVFHWRKRNVCLARRYSLLFVSLLIQQSGAGLQLR